MARSQRIVERRGANHGLHVFLTLITCGLWAITGWPIATMLGRKTVTRIPTYQPPQQYAPPPQAYGQQPSQPYPPQQYQQPGPYGAPQPGPYNQPPTPQPPQPRPRHTSWGQQ